ncbi:MAG: N-acetyl-gamma-glutamyl-phosphate reductase [Desulfobacterales bacterium]|nr:N-acetyl-gamma-glutamyl-phosphate reductase [Desulfobacterales bacterium]
MIRVGIVGATGYAGAELVRILSGHPGVKITVLTSRKYKGERFDGIYPSMTGSVDLTCEKFDADHICDRADLIYTALPHKLPMELIPELIRRGKKVIDLSADFRFGDAKQYEKHYQRHTAKNLLEIAVYGLSEIYHEKIKESDLIGNPGCYPTSVLLPLIPIVKSNLINFNTIIVDSKSGVSGAGRSPSLITHFCETNESFKAYKVATHRHNPEMEEILSFESEQDVRITFVPHLVPMTRGMLTTIYADLLKGIGYEDIKNCLNSFYTDKPFIRICPKGKFPDTLHVRGTNYCDIGFTLDLPNQRLILVSAIDNLVKGAAGQAVQNMNIMFGLDETKGLMNVPFPV